jgi:2-polyprenyl-6-methoxyphenol hydroxylase-like FAD-dependent oxidoreductase
MRHTDIVIAGGGLAGSTAAAMLGRAGYDAVLVDPHAVYPPELRCEKLDGTQTAILRQTGLADAVLRVATHDREAWVARFGRVIEKRLSDQQGILYDTLVNTIREQIPDPTTVITAKVKALSTSADRQTVTLSTGEQISARLVVIANGLNIGLRHTLGMTRRDISPCHSITLGFDLKPADRPAFAFPALTYYGERTSDKVSYLTLFPVGAAMRANLMIYRDLHDPWLRALREAPVETLFAAMPGLKKLTGNCEVVGPIKIRPADLYVTDGYRQPGVVLVGDAFATSCPAAGTGTGKVLTDVERLCNVHIPRWLATPGMDEAKIAAFYDDPVKQAYDAHSATKAFHLRSLSIDPSLSWAARRWARFLLRLGAGTLRRFRTGVSGRRDQAPRDPALHAAAAAPLSRTGAA